MNTKTQSGDQRQALQRSEEKAAKDQPGSFDEEALTDKVVKIPPIGKDKKPIRGLDAPDARKPKG